MRYTCAFGLRDSFRSIRTGDDFRNHPRCHGRGDPRRQPLRDGDRGQVDLAALTAESKNRGGDNGFMLGGGEAASYGTTLDGVSTNTTRALQISWVASTAPPIEAITEFTVDPNGYKAEYGHAGGGVMTFSSKSGTNAFHGSPSDFLRNNR